MKDNDKVTWYLLIPFFGLCWSILGDFFQSFLCSCSFLFSGLMFGPELDTKKSNQFKRWGPLRFLWLPYQSLDESKGFSAQNKDSFIGPVLRFVYFGVILAILIGAVNYYFKIDIYMIIGWLDEQLNLSYVRLILLFFIGTWLGTLSQRITYWISSMSQSPKTSRRKARR
ncbi:MAG: DUF2227 family putative metal-binding protein [Candidatus Caenarcaniphilales bacterium]|nr:DUF2227 family putative metal-binding protein [Candidatus Caenarcaniphilales bacterium]